MYLQYIYIFFIMNCCLINGNPLPTQTVFKMLTSLENDPTYKCPYLRKTALLKPEPTFLTDCSSFHEVQSIIAQSDENSHNNKALCLLYYNNFKSLCKLTTNMQNSTKKWISELDIHKITESYKKNETEICAILKNGHGEEDAKPGIDVILENIKDKLNCLRMCTSFDRLVSPVCSLSAFMANVTLQIQHDLSNINDGQTAMKVKPNVTIPSHADSSRVVDNQLSAGKANSKGGVEIKKEDPPQSSKPIKGSNIDIEQSSISNTGKENEGDPNESETHTLQTPVQILNQNNNNEPAKEVNGLPANSIDTVPKSQNSNVNEMKKQTESLTELEQTQINPSRDNSNVVVDPADDVEKPLVSKPEEVQPNVQERVKPSDNIPLDEDKKKSSIKSEAIPNFGETVQDQLNLPDDMDENEALEPGKETEGDMDYNEQQQPKYSEVKTKPQEKYKPLETDDDSGTFAVNFQTQNIDDSDSYFFAYFMMVCIMFICGYVAYHNKQKILALVVEGRKGRRPSRSRRPNSANYHKLDSNLEEAVTSSCNKNAPQVIY